MSDVVKKPPSEEAAIVLPLVNTQGDADVLIFNVDDIRRLRDIGVLGVLIGTLAQYPQQNFYLSVPLRLMVWEVVWLLDQKHAILVDYVNYRLTKPRVTPPSTGMLSKDGRFVPSTSSEANFVRIANDDTGFAGSSELVLDEHITKHEIPVEKYLAKVDQGMKTKFISQYHTYKYLKNLGYFISPGLKFGGDLVIYPGDPLKFHSYAIVVFDCFNVNELVVGGRLATAVKKNYVIIGDKEEAKPGTNYVDSLFSEPAKQAFSIEWAGFG